jgi:hypothetical protein
VAPRSSPQMSPRAAIFQCGAPRPGERGHEHHPARVGTSAASASISAAQEMSPSPSRSHCTAAPAMNTLPSSTYVTSSPAATHGREQPVVGVDDLCAGVQQQNAPVP